jgi:hypothetical protein
MRNLYRTAATLSARSPHGTIRQPGNTARQDAAEFNRAQEDFLVTLARWNALMCISDKLLADAIFNPGPPRAANLKTAF